MRLLVLGPVRGVGELLAAVELDRVLAAERFVARVGPEVDLAVFQPRKGPVAALELERNRWGI